MDNSNLDNLDDAYYNHEEEDESENESDVQGRDSDAEIDDRSSSKSSEATTKTSEVWKYFTRDVDFKKNKKAICNICGASYVCSGGSTSNLKKHIDRKHSKSNKQELTITDMFSVKEQVSI
jgi:hypothetical protein